MKKIQKAYKEGQGKIPITNPKKIEELKNAKVFSSIC